MLSLLALLFFLLTVHADPANIPFTDCFDADNTTQRATIDTVYAQVLKNTDSLNLTVLAHTPQPIEGLTNTSGGSLCMSPCQPSSEPSDSTQLLSLQLPRSSHSMPGQTALSFATPSVHHLLFLPSTMEQKPIAPLPQVLSLFQQASRGVATGHSLPSSPASAQLIQTAQSCFASMYIPLH